MQTVKMAADNADKLADRNVQLQQMDATLQAAQIQANATIKAANKTANAYKQGATLQAKATTNAAN